MVETITGDTILNLLKNPTGITTTHGEIVTDQAIDHLNIYLFLNDGDTLSNLDGVDGSKTLNVSSRERGAIMIVARIVYMSFLRQHGTTSNLGSLGSSTTDLMSDPTSVAVIKEVAESLVKGEEEEIEVAVG